MGRGSPTAGVSGLSHSELASKLGQPLGTIKTPKTGNPVSAGIFEPDSQGRVLLISKPDATPANAAAVAVTEEPAGGAT